MSATAKKRNIPVDTLRGIACIMLVAYHVIGTGPHNGLKLGEGALKEANEMLAYVRMPLFTFLSGLVYGWRPFSGGWKSFVKGKVRRLLVPMLAVGTSFAILQASTPGANNRVEEWQYLHLKPVAHYWFLESLFIIFLAVLLLESRKLLQSRQSFVLVYLASAIAFVSGIGTVWLSLAGVFYLFPYFLAGLYCSRFPFEFRYSRTTGYAVLGLLLVFLVMFNQHPIDGRRSLLALIVGTAACVALLLAKTRSEWLARIGLYSYSIYLFHIFFTAASRIGLMQSGLTDIWILFVAGTIAGVAGPILVETIALKHNASRLLLLGQKPLAKQ